MIKNKITYKSACKKLVASSFAILISVFLINSSHGQQTQVEKKDVPPAVVETIETTYASCGNNITWYTTRNAKVDYYVATATGENMICESVYDTKGNLIYAITTQTNVKLPRIVQEAIATKHKGWTIKGDKRVIHDFDLNRSYYEVKIENKKKHNTLYFDSSGEEISPQLALFSTKFKVKKKEIPNAVSNRIETDLGCNYENTKWYKYGRLKEIDRYVATSSGRNLTCRAVYDARGNLISSKTIAENVKLPAELTRFIYTEYPGWTITKDKSIVTDFDETTRHYEVIIEKNGSKQTLYFNTEGEEMDPPVS